MPTTEQARHWLDRWDRQQEQYIADREERFRVIADVVGDAAGARDPLTVVDLGAGPGSLSVRLLERLPEAAVFAVDADPLLLGLARAAHGDEPRLRIVEHDLRDPGWVDALAAAGADVDAGIDAVVSTTALHWLTGVELDRVYRQCAGLLRPGGVLVDGDHFGDGPDTPRLHALNERVRTSRFERVGPAGEDWTSWWDAAAAAPELADLTAERGARPLDHNVPDVPLLAEHLRLLRDAGFAEAGTVWQHGDDRVLVAAR